MTKAEQGRSGETAYKKYLTDRISELLPNCIILRNDPNASRMQGIPDITILFKGKWAALEVKVSANAHHQPNQDYYVNQWNRMSFAAFIFPENEEEVLNSLLQFMSN